MGNFNISKLNRQQQRAILSENNNILVLAGAGTGKTSTLTGRISKLIENGVNPQNILAVTFTNKAATEIKDRVSDMVSDDVSICKLTVGTFHGVCNSMLRENYGELGLSPYYQIIDASDQKNIIKTIVAENKELLEIDNSLDLKDSHIVNISLTKISRMKEDGITYKTARNSSDVDWDLVKIFELYEQTKFASSLLDFADLLILAVKLLQIDYIQEEYSKRWQHMLVDEFQDTNKIQIEWIDLIKSKNLFVVGDDDQSIYKFRGADIRNILSFGDKYSNPDIIYLEENYRSTSSILDVANSLIDFNVNRHQKSLWTKIAAGDPVEMDIYNSGSQEANKVINKIRKIISSGVSPSEIAIIYRANYLSRLLEKPLMKYGISYQITGGVGFWQRMEIKDVLSYLMLANNPMNFIALERSLKFPSRGIGNKTIQKIIDCSKDNSINLIEAVEFCLSNKLIKGKAGKSLSSYYQLINDIVNAGIYESILNVINSINISNIYSNEEDADRLDNVNELLAAAIEFEEAGSDINVFLSNATLLGSADNSSTDDCVNLTTAHSAKGLEFEFVFLIAMEDGGFPSSRSLNDADDIEEERRLCYVAITRAKTKLNVSYSKTRTSGGSFNKPTHVSRFLEEIDPSLLKTNAPIDFY